MNEIMMTAVLREIEYRQARLEECGQRPRVAGATRAAPRARLAGLLIAAATWLAPVPASQAAEVPQRSRPLA